LGALVHSIAFWTAAAYFIAAIPTGVLIARARGIDLRSTGSGNIGATNAGRVLGAKLGIAVLVLDTLKAATPVWLASSRWALGHGKEAQLGLACVGFAAVLGHIFPIYLRFRGGKGVACALGVFLALDPAVALAAVVIYGQSVWLSRISAFGSLTAVTAISLSVWIADRPGPEQLLALATAAIIWGRHTSNIRGMLAEARERKRAKPIDGDAGG
jgi:acyl phosphate:glycerol-3-phosphate acyltransferase